MECPCDLLRGAGKKRDRAIKLHKVFGTPLKLWRPVEKVRWGAMAPLAPLAGRHCDTVDDNVLGKKLDELCGAQQRELTWFKFYHSNQNLNQKHFCRDNGIDSNTGDIEVGVQKSSCLGPLLFLVYINDAPPPPHSVQGYTISMYAADTSLCYLSDNLTQLKEVINSDLMKMDTWLQGNNLSSNVGRLILCSFLPRKNVT